MKGWEGGRGMERVQKVPPTRRFLLESWGGVGLEGAPPFPHSQSSSDCLSACLSVCQSVSPSVRPFVFASCGGGEVGTKERRKGGGGQVEATARVAAFQTLNPKP